MKFYEARRGEHLVLQLTGRLDSSTSAAFEKAVTGRIAAGEHRIVFDFGHLDYISSAGLRVLLMSAKQIQAKDGTLTLCGMKDNVSEVFEISGFSGIFSIHDTVEDAISAS